MMQDRFWQVVVGTCFDAANDAFGVAPCRQNQDRSAAEAVATPNDRTQLNTIHTRHHNIEDDQIWRLICQNIQGGIGIAGFYNLKTTAFQHNADQRERADFIIDD